MIGFDIPENYATWKNLMLLKNILELTYFRLTDDTVHFLAAMVQVQLMVSNTALIWLCLLVQVLPDFRQTVKITIIITDISYANYRQRGTLSICIPTNSATMCQK